MRPGMFLSPSRCIPGAQSDGQGPVFRVFPGAQESKLTGWGAHFVSMYRSRLSSYALSPHTKGVEKSRPFCRAAEPR